MIQSAVFPVYLVLLCDFLKQLLWNNDMFFESKKKERMSERQSENKRVICVRCLLVFVLYVDRRFTFRLTRSIFSLDCIGAKKKNYLYANWMVL